MSELQQISTGESASAAPVISTLANFWLRPVDRDSADTWNTCVGTLCETLLQRPAVRLSHRDLDELAITYTRLFVGPRNHLPPVQSVWTTGQLVSAATRSMQTYSERLGLAEGLEGTPADHLGWQLTVLAMMLAAQDRAGADDIIGEYIAAHLTWADNLLAKVVTVDHAGFYSQLAEITQVCLNEMRDLYTPDRRDGC